MIYFMLGAIVGSFMLCLTFESSSLLRKSHCDYCKHILSWRDLIPILSFIFMGGRCRYCNTKLSSKYLISEVTTGAAIFLISFNQVLDITVLSAIAVILIPLAIYDTQYLMIPNFMLILLLQILSTIYFIDSFNNIAFDFTIIFNKIMIFILLHLFFFLTKSIGYGDIKLLSILLLFLPIPFFIALFFVTYLIGGIACIIFLSYKTALKRMPLVPFITSAYFVVIVLYDEINKIYFGGFI
ncbi:prepilin peptidase [Macrococcus animalis]|uniref:prepilin peptidase n=1 Tax=Macrococcus animalis TaxID=3395467 RepID=UPI0039BFA702